MNKKLQLHGFNNLTKTLSFNIYDIAYATGEDVGKYIDYIDNEFNVERLTGVLAEVTSIIGASILHVAHQDYEPQGASVTMMIAEDSIEHIMPEAVVAHLDKSHITVHTYPESHPHDGINTFRADIDVSSCGLVSPLNALDYLIRSFDSDIVTMDYRVRGFTRDVDGAKYFIDHEISSIQDFIPDDIKTHYHRVDLNAFGENIFHTKMMVRDWKLEDYLFGDFSKVSAVGNLGQIGSRLKHEMDEIFCGRHLPVA